MATATHLQAGWQYVVSLLGSLSDVVVTLATVYKELPLPGGDTQIGTIRVSIPENSPAWEDGIVPLLNSGLEPNTLPRAPAWIGYSALLEQANKAHSKNRSVPAAHHPEQSQIPSSAKSTVILLDNSLKATKTPNPAAVLNEFVLTAMRDKNGEFKEARSTLHKNLGQLFISYDSLKAFTLTSRSVASKLPKADLDDLDAGLDDLQPTTTSEIYNVWDDIHADDHEAPNTALSLIDAR